MKKISLIMCVLLLVVLLVGMGSFAGCKSSGAKAGAEREAALPGNAVSPADFPIELLPGISEIGAKPLKKYKFAFSNGDMTDNWRLAFVKDFEGWAAKYIKEFGIDYIWTNSGSDTVKQISDVESLLSLKPDLLFLAPMEDEPMQGIVDECNNLGIPLIVVDRPFINKTPGKDSMYKMAITQDYFAQGVIQGKMIVNYLTGKFGTPKGHVIEMTGVLGSSPAVLRSQGMHLVFDKYPDIRIIDSVPTDWSRSLTYEKMEDFLQIYPANYIDVVQGAGDGDVMGAIEVIKAKGRTEIFPGVFGMDGQLVYFESMVAGEAAGTSETSPYYGMIAFEYGIRFLNGEFDGKDYQSTIMLPMRYWDLNPANNDILLSHIQYLKDKGLEFIPVDAGGFDKLSMDISDIYPKNYLEDPSVLKIEPFAVDEPLAEYAKYLK
jgi:ABC-type sugar transport system substrate-binding protein